MERKSQDYIRPMVELALHIAPDHEKYLTSKLKRRFKLFKPFIKKGPKTLMVKFIARKGRGEELAPQVGFDLTYDVGKDLYNVKAFYSPPYPKIDIMNPESFNAPKEPIHGNEVKGLYFDDIEDPAKVYYRLLQKMPKVGRIATKSPYYKSILKILQQTGKRNVDPRHVEALMRVEHRTLDGLSSSQFKKEVGISADLVKKMGEREAESLARSFGL